MQGLFDFSKKIKILISITRLIAFIVTLLNTQITYINIDLPKTIHSIQVASWIHSKI